MDAFFTAGFASGLTKKAEEEKRKGSRALAAIGVVAAGGAAVLGGRAALKKLDASGAFSRMGRGSEIRGAKKLKKMHESTKELMGLRQYLRQQREAKRVAWMKKNPGTYTAEDIARVQRQRGKAGYKGPA